jgi:hypothetical protein
MDETKRCPYCAEEILAAAIKCKHCGSALDVPHNQGSHSTNETGERKRVLRIAVGIVLGSLAVWWLLSPSPSPQPDNQPPAGTATSTHEQAVEPGTAASTAHLPALEARFVQAVAQAQSRSRTAANDMQRGGIKAERDRAICALISSARAVSNWSGIVKTVDSNSDGKGVLAVSIADGVSVTTWNNDLSDFRDHTLIEPESPLFDVVSKMHVGRLVFFSGSFEGGEEKECIGEESLTLHGKLEEPEFTFKFSSVSSERSSEPPAPGTSAQPVAEDELPPAATAARETEEGSSANVPPADREAISAAPAPPTQSNSNPAALFADPAVLCAELKRTATLFKLDVTNTEGNCLLSGTQQQQANQTILSEVWVSCTKTAQYAADPTTSLHSCEDRMAATPVQALGLGKHSAEAMAEFATPAVVCAEVQRVAANHKMDVGTFEGGECINRGTLQQQVNRELLLNEVLRCWRMEAKGADPMGMLHRCEDRLASN